MFEFLGTFVADYGAAGLFIVSMIGSTVFVPFTVEITFPVLAAAGMNRLLILAAAVAGAVAGTYVNYMLGSKGVDYAKRFITEKDLEKASNIMNRYGWFGVFAVMALPFPLPVDPLTVLCGASKMNKKEFVLAVAAGKIIKYSALLGLISLFI